jgi:phosphocarrier protein
MSGKEAKKASKTNEANEADMTRDNDGGEAMIEPIICNEKGLHARASALFVKCAEKFNAEILVERDGERVSGLSVMDLLMLAAPRGTQIKIIARGPDATKAASALNELVERGFYESEGGS